MKHGVVLLAVVCAFAGVREARAQAPNYQAIRVDVGIAGAYTPSYGRAGFGGVLEAKFNITDNIAAGLRFDGVVSFGGSIGPEGSTSVSVGAAAATLLEAEYYLTTSSVRPFIGAGLGIYAIVSQSIEADDANTSVSQVAGRFFGVAPSLGIDLGRLRLAVTYNLILGADIVLTQNVGMPNETETTYGQSYVLFELSFRIGGARKPPPPTPLPPGGYYNPTGPYMPPVAPAPQ
jgi:hypothetical protein